MNWTTILKCAVVSVFLILVFLISAFAGSRLFNFNSGDSLSVGILAFVGVLATFVVISNYAQTAETKAELNKKIKNIENNVTYLEDSMEQLKEVNDSYTQTVIKLESDKKNGKSRKIQGIKRKN